MKTKDVAKKMRGTGIKGLSMREAERNDSWFRKGKGYPPAGDMRSKKGKESLNPVQRGKDNMVMEGRNEQERS